MADTRTNETWLRDLGVDGTSQEEAITDLRALLLRAVLYSFNRNLDDFGTLSRAEILQLAEDCAQDALIAVMSHLQDFRGESKFSTWVYKFAINKSLMAARHQRWKGVSLDELTDSGENAFSEWLMQDKSDGIALEQSAMQAELHQVIQTAIQEDLTDKQRQALILLVFNEVPLDEVVRHTGSNRNAVYKLLHDARARLKTSLQTHGFEVEEALASFVPER